MQQEWGKSPDITERRIHPRGGTADAVVFEQLHRIQNEPYRVRAFGSYGMPGHLEKLWVQAQ
jgi:hypothetical protein